MVKYKYRQRFSAPKTADFAGLEAVSSRDSETCVPETKTKTKTSQVETKTKTEIVQKWSRDRSRDQDRSRDLQH